MSLLYLTTSALDRPEPDAGGAAVLDEAARLDVPVHRVSQGSGVMMLTDAEITEMAGPSRSSGRPSPGEISVRISTAHEAVSVACVATEQPLG